MLAFFISFPPVRLLQTNNVPNTSSCRDIAPCENASIKAQIVYKCADTTTLKRNKYEMRHSGKALLLLMNLSLLTPSVSQADVIENACRGSERRAATGRLCSCIQSVAEVNLTRHEQKIVSKWFYNPDEAMRTSRSNRRKDEELWTKYRIFGNAAEQQCG